MKATAHRSIAMLAAVGLSALFASHVQAQSPAKIKAEAVTDAITVFYGQGGNIGVFAGSDGIFMIDDQYAPMAPAIREALAAQDLPEPKFLINTHWHHDHTGGNETFGGDGTIIVAHENVRERLSKDQFVKAFDRTFPAMPSQALPVITFTDAIQFHLNGETLDVFHVPPSHTDGDSMIHFTGSNVLHTGDVFFNGIYPFIDVGAGGSARGMVAAVDLALDRVDAQTRIIPGHGPVAGVDELRAFRDMLAAVDARVTTLKRAGSSLKQVQAAKPTQTFDAEWADGFLSPDQFVAIVFAGIP